VGFELGTLCNLWWYPVKSLRGRPLETVRVESGGIPGDRGRALFVRSGHARQGKPYRGKEHHGLHLLGGPEEAVRLAASSGVDAAVRDDDGHYFDLAPISLILDSWLAEASALVGYSLEPVRFRPNFFVAANGFDDTEASLTGARLRIGDTVLRVRKPIERCVTPSYDLETGKSDPAVVRAIAQQRRNEMGIYCDVEEPGEVRLGDAVLVER